MISYLMEIIMYILSVTVSEIFPVEIFIPWRLEWAKVKCKYANQKSLSNFVFDGNSNVNFFFYRLPYIHSWNVHDLDLDL